jgi:hypothetical protein
MKASARKIPPCRNAALILQSYAQTANIWDGGGTTDLWSDVFNWDNDAFTGYGTLTFAGSTRTTNIVDANNQREQAVVDLQQRVGSEQLGRRGHLTFQNNGGAHGDSRGTPWTSEFRRHASFQDSPVIFHRPAQSNL